MRMLEKDDEHVSKKRFSVPTNLRQSFQNEQDSKSRLISRINKKVINPTETCEESKIASPQCNQETTALSINHSCTKLRKLIKDCMDKNHLSAASFFADKLVEMGDGKEEDIWLLAKSFYANKEYRRAVSVLKKYKLFDAASSITPPKFRHLAAQCLAANKQWDECIAMLDPIAPDDDERVILSEAKNVKSIPGEELNIISSICLLKGIAFEASENRKRATDWYKLAFKCDPHCSEAFFKLIDKQMLSTEEEIEFLSSTNFEHCDEYIQPLYASYIGKFQGFQSIHDRFVDLESKYRLKNSADILIAKAEAMYYQRDSEAAYKLSKIILKDDPFDHRCMTVFISTLVELKKSSELFHSAHQLVDSYPEKSVSWYAIGCYYLLVKKYDAAQRYFHKSTTIDPNYAASWIGFGNAFAAQDESDQAMASYRTASRLLPGSHLPLMYIGMEYLRTNNLTLALQFLENAKSICSFDPLLYNELGIVAFKRGEYENAIGLFEKSLALCKDLPKKLMSHWEPFIYNLGHAYRKLGRYEDAISAYQKGLGIYPRNASTHAALGFTLHLQGRIDEAIQSYHTALGLRSEDTLTAEMLTNALNEVLESPNESKFDIESMNHSMLTSDVLEISNDFSLSSIERSTMMNQSNLSMSMDGFDEDMSL